MSEAPKIPRIIRERLQTATAVNATEHPEANLLSAFSENLLRADERDQVLQHLATCAACRQVVALAAVSRREPEPLVVTERRPLRWKILRWTALGASAAAMVAVVAVYQQKPPRQLEPTGATITARLEQAPAATPAPETQDNDKKDKKIASQPPAAKKAPVTRTSDMLAARSLKKADTLQEKAESEPMRAAGALQPETSNEISLPAKMKTSPEEHAMAESVTDLDESKQAETAAANFYRARPSPPMSIYAQQRSVQAPATPAGGGLAGAHVMSRADNRPSPARSTDLQSQAGPASVLAQIGAARRAERHPAAKTVAPPNGFTVRGLRSSGSTIAVPQWRLRDSHLEKLSDDGRTWQGVAIPGVGSVTSLASMGAGIWAAASPAEIYYSSDSGAHWTRQWSYAQAHPLGAEDPSAQIIRIQFDDEQTGSMEVTTRSARWPHQIWITNNGGATWLLETAE